MKQQDLVNEAFEIMENVRKTLSSYDIDSKGQRIDQIELDTYMDDEMNTSVEVTSFWQCNMVLDSPGVYTMDKDILNCTNDKIINITEDNVTLDCDGHNITGNNTFNQYGIYSSQFNTTTKNCNIRV